MGCTQSTERKPVAQQQMPLPTKIAASPAKVETAIKVAAPAVQKEDAKPAADGVEPIQFDAVSEQPSAVESAIPTPKAETAEPVATRVEVAVPEIAEVQAPAEAPAVAEAQPIICESVSVATPTVVVAPVVFASPAVPLLALAATRVKKPVKSPRAKKVVSNDENAGSPLMAQSAVKKAFGASKMTGNALFATKKVVGFDAVPAPVTPATKQAKAKAKARKAAGKRAGNFDHEKFLEQCAMFERQLTHRSTLDAHLNSR